MTPEEVKASPLYPAFVEWGSENGVWPEHDHVDDWMPWWECFNAGAEASRVALALLKNKSRTP